MILTTKTKIGLARVLYRTVSTCRSMASLTDETEVRRGGLNWRLDLSEGLDLSIYLFGMTERSTVMAFKKIVREGDTVLDVGANVGAHTLHLGRAVGKSGRVIAFEPTDFAFEKLARNLALNPELNGRVRCEQVLLAADPGGAMQTELYSSWPLVKREGLHEKHLGQLKTTRNAVSESLDHYLERTGIDRVDAIKIDVDGHEYPVLKGARECLTSHRPRMIMELSPYIHSEENYSFGDLIGLLRDHRYSMTTVDGGNALPMDAEALYRSIPDGAGINVILEPL